MMRVRNLRLVILLMGIALVGLSVLQYRWLYAAWAQEQRAYRMQVQQALHRVALNVERRQLALQLEQQENRQRRSDSLKHLQQHQKAQPQRKQQAHPPAPAPNARNSSPPIASTPTEEHPNTRTVQQEQGHQKRIIRHTAQHTRYSTHTAANKLTRRDEQTEHREVIFIAPSAEARHKKVEAVSVDSMQHWGRRMAREVEHEVRTHLCRSCCGTSQAHTCFETEEQVLRIRLDRSGDPPESRTIAINIGGLDTMLTTIISQTLPRVIQLPESASDTHPMAPHEVETEIRQTLEQKIQVLQEVSSQWLEQEWTDSLDAAAVLDTTALDSILAAELQQQGIRQAYHYTLHHPDSARNGAVPPTSDSVQTFTVQLNPDRLFGPAPRLHVHFIESQPFFSLALLPEMGLSGLFILMLSFAFGYYLSVIYRQKKLSEVTNDFINNMTHEFKTPITTIRLTTDLLKHGDALLTSDQRVAYAGIIDSENQRLQGNVDRILRMAELENHQIQLDLTEVEIHALIHQVCNQFRFVIEGQRDGQLHLDLNAPESTIRGDAVHLGNVLTNLLDNANKYSPDAPEITIRTWLQPQYFCISITDTGKGMNRSEQARIFDKFYRISSGNRHDVKGFGLGLSYVKAIVDAHRGEIAVNSRVGQGSCFTLYLPHDASRSRTGRQIE